MKKITILLFVSIMFFILTACQSSGGDSKWHTYKSETGGFSVKFPDAIDKVKEITKTGIKGDETYDIYNFMLSKDIVYNVFYCDILKSDLKNFSVKEYLDSRVDLMVSGTHGKILFQSIVKLGDYEGREVKFDAPNDLVCKARFFVVKNRVYCAAISTDTENSLSGDIGTFLDSFKIIN